MNKWTRLMIIFISSIVLGFAFNMFLLPHEILAGGVTGIAMMLGLVTPLNAGIWMIILNIPILIVGWMKLGKTFIANSLFSVVVTSVSMLYIPVVKLTEDALLSSVFGGVVAGVAIGLIIRFYSSTGGFDVIGLLLSMKRDIPLGTLVFILNSAVVFVSGFIFSWELAMYTMASIYITGLVIDRVHTRHIKLSLMVVTNQGEAVKKELLDNLYRGITVVDGEGAYSSAKVKVLYSVISRHELAFVRPLIKNIDPKAFVSISETMEVMGNFRKDDNFMKLPM
ncbi:YitT family protein [Microbacterium sp. APC 3898]|uniref:YitT family protein n=2 Tax=Planococcus TaxID=1372 RepID=A0ABT7ZMI8_9BACL|nr:MULTISPECIES: YitT family protein [Terrabacteria group]MBD8015987.1 YitT family protein [Planococcus wigleyi]MDN3428390.1 YitT family protein [Planococcus sp. APC 4016]MDN3438560.1 YitT family protein [Planococcus sp. APC 3900]MDN3498903.1 YitT family protein [Microbacterium sp. APC 3898]